MINFKLVHNHRVIIILSYKMLWVCALCMHVRTKCQSRSIAPQKETGALRFFNNKACGSSGECCMYSRFASKQIVSFCDVRIFHSLSVKFHYYCYYYFSCFLYHRQVQPIKWSSLAVCSAAIRFFFFSFLFVRVAAAAERISAKRQK